MSSTGLEAGGSLFRYAEIRARDLSLDWVWRRRNLLIWFPLHIHSTTVKDFIFAHKRGEVVVPAGGETGVPRCLAEDLKLPKSSLFIRNRYFNYSQRIVKRKNYFH